MKTVFVDRINAVSGSIWLIPVLLFLFWFFWFRAVRYRKPDNGKPTLFDRLFFGLNFLLRIHLRRLAILDASMIILSLAAMLALDATVRPGFETFPFLVLPVCFVIGVVGGAFLLTA